MATSHIWLIISLEALAVTALVCLLLLIYIHKLRRLVERQQQTLRQVVGQAEESPSNPSPVAAPNDELSAKNYLERELAVTERYFDAHHSTVPMEEFDAKTASLEARAALIRHKLLALELTDTARPWGPDAWRTWLAELEPLLAEDQQRLDELQQALETRDKRIANLEHFKQLFFDLEQQWEAASTQADIYHQQLSAMGRELDNPDEFDKTLQLYHEVYNDISTQLSQSRQAPAETTEKLVREVRTDPKTADELAKLRTVAADQHRIIGKLQKRLREAESAEQKELVIKELEGQLQQHLRYIKESETCVELLEKELSSAMQKVNELERTQGADTEENQAMRSTLRQFTAESKELLEWINKLETENDELKATLARAPDSASGDGKAQQTLRAELEKQQRDYAALEEKYLALKTKSRPLA